MTLSNKCWDCQLLDRIEKRRNETKRNEKKEEENDEIAVVVVIVVNEVTNHTIEPHIMSNQIHKNQRIKPQVKKKQSIEQGDWKRKHGCHAMPIVKFQTCVISRPFATRLLETKFSQCEQQPKLQTTRIIF